MNQKLPGPRIRFRRAYLLPLILFLILIWLLFGGSFLASGTEMIYSEFKTALRAGQIQAATVGIDQISGALTGGKAYHTVRVEDPGLLRDLDAHKVNTSGQVASNGRIWALLVWLLPLALMGAFIASI
jgi:cell division protease FtsH